ncbi:AGAP009243-PA, partial [Anopheles gambiae str. PEST]
ERESWRKNASQTANETERRSLSFFYSNDFFFALGRHVVRFFPSLLIMHNWSDEEKRR